MAHPTPKRGITTRAKILAAALAVVHIVGLSLIAAADGDRALGVAGVIVAGVPAVYAVSWLFYAVGRSEDRQREADARDRAAQLQDRK